MLSGFTTYIVPCEYLKYRINIQEENVWFTELQTDREGEESKNSTNADITFKHTTVKRKLVILNHIYFDQYIIY